MKKAAVAFWVVCLCSAALAATGCLALADLEISGIRVGYKSGSAIKTWGHPLSTSDFKNDQYQAMSVWQYAHHKVELNSSGNIEAITLTDNFYPTCRGVRVGDPQDKVFELYQHPDMKSDKVVTFLLLCNQDETRGVSFFFSGGSVSSIRLGEVEEY